MDPWSLFPVVFGVLSFALWLVPVVAAVIAVVLLSRMSRDVETMRRQLDAMAGHAGAPVAPAPVRVNPPTWTWAVVAAVVLLILGGLAFAGSRPDQGGTFEYRSMDELDAEVMPEPAMELPEVEQAP